ncbi:hypothetical protein [Phenylobacterium sp.]|uniref:hypothetical protein n=1 Tax=Phenylobacterium sp. TaxID=1871053 RepID=UPI002FE227A9
MTDPEQYVLALELLVSLRVAQDPPEVRQEIARAIEAGLDTSGAVERAIRERALRILRECEPVGPRPV